MFAAKPMPATTERGAGVLQAAEQAGRREDEQHRGQAEHRDAEVGRGLLGDGRLRRRTRRPAAGRRTSRPIASTTPRPRASQMPSIPDGHRAALVAGAEPAGDGRCGAVGEKDHQADDRLQHRAGQAEAGQGSRAEVADHGGVGEQEQRLSDERPEGGDREAKDFAVHGPSAEGAQGHSSDSSSARGRGPVVAVVETNLPGRPNASNASSERSIRTHSNKTSILLSTIADKPSLSCSNRSTIRACQPRG